MQFAQKHFAALAVAGLLLTATAARADEWNKRTVITIEEAIQLPTIVLEPGTYVLKLLDSPSDRHIVQVFDKTEQHLLTTVLAINNYRLEPRGKTVFTFWEVPAGQPPAVRAWFYPGDNFGQEFTYPKKLSVSLAASNKQPVPTADTTQDMKTAAIRSTTETGDQNELDKRAYEKPTETVPPPPPVAVTEPQQPAPEPAPAPAVAPPPAPAPEPAPEPVPSELPHTASSLPLIGLIGAGSLAAYLLLLSRR